MLGGIGFAARFSSKEKPKEDQGEGAQEAGEGYGGPANTNKNNRGDTDDKRENESRSRLRLDAVAVFTGLLTCVTAIQVWAFIQSERASLAFDGVSFEGGELKPQKPVFLSLRFRNGGKSTAFVKGGIVNNRFVSKGRKLILPPEYVYDGPQMSLTPILPGGIWSVQSSVRSTQSEDTLVLDEASILAIKSGVFRFHVFGHVDFVDDFTVFGPKTLGFCAVYNPSGDAASQFQQCEENAYTYAR
jgi:hypothetical protein